MPVFDKVRVEECYTLACPSVTTSVATLEVRQSGFWGHHASRHDDLDIILSGLLHTDWSATRTDFKAIWRASEAGDVGTHFCFVFDEAADSFVLWGTISERRLLSSQHFFWMDIGAVRNSEGNL